ncbi:MAG: DUF4282 domain-containing protein [Intrasporangium sp.]|uniref:DUF4282 domain-containing protein n=1 Tax=Intrasporangium sp. TaxID=1925024 RepID=UPI002648ACBB|nr:DUF4282 domain-containing protein [Intrasporangium sp.]MDN5795617.1 DUF4282 domain-containing protein [Intrasporangium sp.]
MSDESTPERGAFGARPTPPQGGALGPGPGSVGFFSALFDFSFTHFVTPKLVRFVYVLITVFLGLLWLVSTITAFATDASVGLLALVGGGFVFLIYLALSRMSLEFFLSVVRMSEDIHKRLPTA